MNKKINQNNKQVACIVYILLKKKKDKKKLYKINFKVFNRLDLFLLDRKEDTSLRLFFTFRKKEKKHIFVVVIR